MHYNNRGLTLVEMLLTVSLMAAMMLISFPKVKDAMVAESVRGARRMVTTSIAQARGVAATRGCAILVVTIRQARRRSLVGLRFGGDDRNRVPGEFCPGNRKAS